MPGLGTALFDRHVFVDLETTGLDPARDRVLELGALFVEDGRIVGRVERMFSSEVPVPAEITALTGLTTRSGVGRPAFTTSLPELSRLLRGWTVVAHNAEFERSFFGGLFERLAAPVLDSCELVHFLHPELPSHSLDALLKWTGLAARASHRALQDCEDTHAVLTHVLEGVIAQGRGQDVADLLGCLTVGGPSAGGALTALLQRVHQRCVGEAASAVALISEGASAPSRAHGEGAVTYGERASRAYLRALERRASSLEASAWFRRRFPAVEALLPAAAPR